MFITSLNKLKKLGSKIDVKTQKWIEKSEFKYKK